jgi:glycosyltransferase involved in cell wall biosynthesis
MIKVCHIVNLITGQADGVYTHLKMIFKNYDRSEFEHVLIFQGNPKIETELKTLDIKVYISESLEKKISVKAFLDIYKVVKKNKIDIIHAHLIKPYAIAGLTNIFLKKKLIFNYHGIFLKNNPYYNIFERFVYYVVHSLIYLFTKVDAVLVPSIRSKELLINETKLFREPLVYYNGYSIESNKAEVDTDLISYVEELAKQKTIIALLGRLEIDKRVDRAVKLVKELLDKQYRIHLLVFGDGSLKTELENLISHLKLNEYIDLLGYKSGLKNYYKFFDILLFTSDWEGMPLTLWEAMANGVPVVAPDVGGFREIIEENACGLIYEPGNILDAEEKIITLLNSIFLRKQFSINGRIASVTKYDMKKFIYKLEQIYSQLYNTN